MRFSKAIPVLAMAGLTGLAAMPATMPAHASGTQTLNPPRVCLENESGEALYFRAVYDGVSTGGTMLGAGGSFCSARPAPKEVRISRERRSATLCSHTTFAGETYTLIALSEGGGCRWESRAH